MKTPPIPRERFDKSWLLFNRRLRLWAREHINRQCVALGVSFNWNHEVALELEFVFWTVEIAIVRKQRFK